MITLLNAFFDPSMSLLCCSRPSSSVADVCNNVVPIFKWRCNCIQFIYLLLLFTDDSVMCYSVFWVWPVKIMIFSLLDCVTFTWNDVTISQENTIFTQGQVISWTSKLLYLAVTNIAFVHTFLVTTIYFILYRQFFRQSFILWFNLYIEAQEQSFLRSTLRILFIMISSFSLHFKGMRIISVISVTCRIIRIPQFINPSLFIFHKRTFPS